MTPIKIDQIAIGVFTDAQVNNYIAGIDNLLTLGVASDWIYDDVTFDGHVSGKPVSGTVAALNFQNDLIIGDVQFEILHFTKGDNWHRERYSQNQLPFISHFGFHVDSRERFDEIRLFFKERGIKEIQIANTTHHTNANIPLDRSYHYIIFDTLHVFGFDLKMILRATADDEATKPV